LASCGSLGFLVLELAEVHQATHRRLRHGRNLNQIHARFFRRWTTQHGPSDDADLLTIFTRSSALPGVDFAVDALLLFLS
jgi:hypothetical protein